MNATDLMTVDEVAETFRVSRATITRWADDGLLPAIRLPGGRRRFHRSVIEKILASGLDGDAGAEGDQKT